MFLFLFFQSDLYASDKGLVVRNAARANPVNPSINLGSEFEKVKFVSCTRIRALYYSTRAYSFFPRLRISKVDSSRSPALLSWIACQYEAMYGSGQM